MTLNNNRLNQLTNHSGYTLIGVVLIITLISVLGMSMIGLTLNSVKTSSAERDDQSVFYIAEAGLNVEMANIKEIVINALESYKAPAGKTCSGSTNREACFENIKKAASEEYLNNLENQVLRKVTRSNFESLSKVNIKPEAVIEVEFLIKEGNYARKYKISSIGKIEDTQRILEQEFTITWPGKDDKLTGMPSDDGGSTGEIISGVAAYVKGNIEHNGGKVTGDIGTLKCDRNTISVTNGGAEVIGNIFVPEDCSYKNIKVDQWMINEGKIPAKANGSSVKSIPELPEFPTIPKNYTIHPDQLVGENGGFRVINNANLSLTDYRVSNYTLSMDENLKFNDIQLKSNYTLNINTGNTDKILIVNKLNIEQGHINIIGSGKLTIFIENNFNIGGDSTINNKGKSDQVNIFYAGKNKVETAGNQKIVGSLYAERADIIIGGSGKITGNIFTGGNKVTVSGAGDADAKVVLAPNAHVEITGSGRVIGTVFANSLYMSGGGDRIIYGDPVIIDGPIALPDPEPKVPEKPVEFEIDEYLIKLSPYEV